jgi:glycine hydroxymethyltransferase
VPEPEPAGPDPVLSPPPAAPEASRRLIAGIAERTANEEADAIRARIGVLAEASRTTYEEHCINLDPAGNVMSPAAEELLACGLGSRPSLGYPGAKHEAGLEAIEEIEVIAAELAAEAFGARFVEIRPLSGAIANLAVFMAVGKPGDPVITPPPDIGGHASHQMQGAAGLFGFNVHPAPIDASRYCVDLDRLRKQALELRPRLITLGSSLNLWPPPLPEVRAIANEAGALLLYDAAHVAGLIAGGAWLQPLAAGAHIVTMSTYKSLGGPPGGLILTNDAALAQRIDRVVYPGLIANFDAGRIAALAMTLVDTKTDGTRYAAAMVATARALAGELSKSGVPVFAQEHGPTASHQFALVAHRRDGAAATVSRLRRANLLASTIGLPGQRQGVRLGTPELVRCGMEPRHMGELAQLIARALECEQAETIASEVTAFRRRFSRSSLRAAGKGGRLR